MRDIRLPKRTKKIKGEIDGMSAEPVRSYETKLLDTMLKVLKGKYRYLLHSTIITPHSHPAVRPLFTQSAEPVDTTLQSPCLELPPSSLFCRLLALPVFLRHNVVAPFSDQTISTSTSLHFHSPHKLNSVISFHCTLVVVASSSRL